MIDPVRHLLLFVLVSVVVVSIGAFYSERDDAKAFASLPKRLLTFLVGCSILAGIMLFCEHVFAAVG